MAVVGSLFFSLKFNGKFENYFEDEAPPFHQQKQEDFHVGLVCVTSPSCCPTAQKTVSRMHAHVGSCVMKRNMTLYKTPTQFSRCVLLTIQKQYRRLPSRSFYFQFVNVAAESQW